MRVAVVSSYYPNNVQRYRGHSAYYTLQHLSQMAEVRVFCPLAIYPSWSLPRRFAYYRVDTSYKPGSVPVDYLEYPAVPVVSRPFNPYLCARSLAPRLAAFHPDVILNYFIYPEGCSAVLLGTRTRVPVVLGAIGSDLNRIPDPLTRWHTMRAIRGARYVLTVSAHLREQAIRMGAPPERTRTVLNGCETAVFCVRDQQQARLELGVQASAEVILFVGWLAPTKGVRELWTAFTRIAAQRPRAVLVCAGEGFLSEELRSSAENAGLSERLVLPGACTSAQVAKWLNAADVFCLPSYAEGCPNVVLEALACGKPVVASRVGGIPELIDANTGILVEPRDAEGLAAALDAALHRDWDSTCISGRSRRSWAHVAEDTMEVCRAAVGG